MHAAIFKYQNMVIYLQLNRCDAGGAEQVAPPGTHLQWHKLSASGQHFKQGQTLFYNYDKMMIRKSNPTVAPLRIKCICLDKCWNLSWDWFKSTSVSTCCQLVLSPVKPRASPALQSQTHLSFGGQLNHRFPKVKFGVSAAHFMGRTLAEWADSR